ncbi:MAG: hypothetical protein ACOCQ4_03450 [bacterium]
MHRNIKILHREIQGKRGQAEYFVLIEYYRDIPTITYFCKIPKMDSLPEDYNDVEVYALLIPN